MAGFDLVTRTRTVLSSELNVKEKRIKYFAIGCLCLIIIIAFYGFVVFREMTRQMNVGKHYMDSLSESDIQNWISRSEDLLEKQGEAGETKFFYQEEISADLIALKIIRVDVLKDSVRYMWLGGLDHTGLIVTRLPDGEFEIYAQYNDHSGRTLWPKEKP